MFDLSQLKMDLDPESLTIYFDPGNDEEYVPVVYWHIEEVEEDATVAFSMANAIHLFYTDPRDMLERLGLSHLLN